MILGGYWSCLPLLWPRGACLLLLAACGWAASAQGEWRSASWPGMGTQLSVELWETPTHASGHLIEEIQTRFAALERVMSRHDPQAELHHLNRYAAERPIAVSPTLMAVIKRSLDFSRLSGGAFDVTFAAVGNDYALRNGVRPSDSLIRQHLPGVGYRFLLLDEAEHTIRYQHALTQIDLGGIGKGFAIDDVVAWLREQGVQHAVVTAGGDTRLLGDRRGRPWVVGIRDPRQADRLALSMPLANEAISTSGDYERYFIGDGGEWVHHILSPVSGKPVRGVQSVSVIGPDATSTDALSTTVFVLGVEKGLALINQLPEFEAVVIDDRRKVHYSSGLMAPGAPAQ